MTDLVTQLREQAHALTRANMAAHPNGPPSYLVAARLHVSAADEIKRLQEAKRAALAIADERSKENVALRAALKPFAAEAKVLADYFNGQMPPADMTAFRGSNLTFQNFADVQALEQA